MSYEKLTKMSGYLEKRGKLSIMGRWKKWWCVLEGQLLLYYKSRLDYANLSPCCGSLNMALVRNVQPNIGHQIHIVTHTQLIILRTKNKEKQQQWFHALVGVLPQNSYLSPLFYFSTRSLEYKRKSDRKKRKDKRKSFIELEKFPDSSKDQYSFSDNVKNRTVIEIQTLSANQEEIQTRTEKNVSRLLECDERRDKLTRSFIKYSSEINIRRCSSYHSVNAASLQSDETSHRRSISCECVFSDYYISSVERYEFLTRFPTQSDEKISNHSQQYMNSVPSITCDLNKVNTCRRSTLRRKKNNGTFSKRSLSFLKKIFKKKRKKNFHLSTSSLSHNLHSHEEIDTNLNETTEKIEENPVTIVNIENTPNSSILDLQERISIRTIENDESTSDKIREITSYNNSDEERTTNNEYETNKSSISETETESSSTDSANIMIDSLQVEEKLPDLPIKNANRLSPNHTFEHINSTYHETNSFSDEISNKEITSIDRCKNMDLDSLLLQLTTLNNNECDKSHQSLEFNNNVIEDPDYDIPRPHTSLISETDSDASINDKNNSNYSKNNDVSSQKHDSLSIDMAPDSLEMPWLLNDNTCNINYWTTKKELLCLENDSGSEYDYHDSLNSNNKYCL